MLEFVVGGLYTLILLIVGVFAGYFIGTRKFDAIISDVRRQVSRPSNNSGPIKPMTKMEREQEGNKEVQKVKSILGDFD